MRKDFLDFLKNRALLLSVLAPILLSGVFIRIAERAQETQVRLALVTASETDFVAAFDDTPAFRVDRVSTLAEATDRVETGKADLAVSLPRDFDRTLREAMGPGASPDARPSIRVVVRQDRGPVVAVGLSALVEMLRAYAQQAAPVDVEMQTLGVDEKVVRKGRLASAWVLFALLVGFTVVASSLIEERERGTWEAILVTRAGLGSVLLGKALVGFVICVASSSAILAINGLLRAPWGLTAAVLVGGSAFVVAVGLWMGALFPNMAAANAGLSLVFMVLFVPVYLVDFASNPVGAAWIRLLPSHTLMDSLQRALEGGTGSAGVAVSAAVLLAWAAGCALAAAASFKLAQARA